MSDSRLNQELASVVNRLMDRFLPEPVTPSGRGDSIALWFSAFLGTLVWAGGLIAYLMVAEVVSSGNFLVFAGLSILVGVLLMWLIARSFDRGRPLTFFFLGLIVPTLTVRILRVAFPF